ncbi:MAG: hypothetical protein J3R72DRAFT_87721 [Linnemannia gamsii]|nr:MAG: hypothetical protein J3R72DRAFT_87721 [Linnemannia gamsii]
MSLALNINPIEIPELLFIIGSHLTAGDHKQCMLVSKTWLLLFQTHTWSHLIYSRQGIPFLDKYGHLVRRVTTYGVDDRDLGILARECRFVRSIKLVLKDAVSWRGLRGLVEELTGVRELSLHVWHCTPRFMLGVAQLKRLQSFEFSMDPYNIDSCNLKMLLGIISECQSLVSLKVTHLVDNTIILPTKVKAPLQSSTSAQVDVIAAMPQPVFQSAPIPPDASTSLLARLGRFLGICSPCSTHSLSFTFRADSLSAEQARQEPWRRFVVRPSPPSQVDPNASNDSLYTEAEDHLLRHATINMDPFPLLRRLHLSRISTPDAIAKDNSPSGLEILFRKTPHLEDLFLDCSNIFPSHLANCLDAITDTCHLLQSLELVNLRPISQNDTKLRRFFQQHRPDLRIFRLQSCSGLEFAINLIPPSTIAGLERVSFEYSLQSHPILHKFMTHAKRLQYFTWKTEGRTVAMPPYRPLPENQRISAFLEPWACYGTIRHIEQNQAIIEKDCFEAYYHRLTQMERLVSLGVSITDIRRSMMAMTRKEDGDGLDTAQQQQQELQELQLWSSATMHEQYMDTSSGHMSSNAPHSHCAQPSPSPAQEQDQEHEKCDDKGNGREEGGGGGVGGVGGRGGWYFNTIQELVLDMIGVIAHTQLLDTRQLSLDEMKYILAAFPKLRKIRYRGRIYPLDHETRKYLEGLEASRRIMVLHVTQSAPIM